MPRLVMLARYWTPGSVKTRLARHVGPEHAARLQQACVRTLAERFSTVADERRLALTPPEHQAEVASAIGPAWRVVPQASGDLGARMRTALQSALDEGAERVVLIGSDSPTLPRVRVEEAFTRLDEADVVLGPSDDGGYYLVGVRRRVPDMFCDIAWGTSQVWGQTLARISTICVATLPPWYDVDELDDLRRLAEELRHQPAAEYAALAEAVAGCLAELR